MRVQAAATTSPASRPATDVRGPLDGIRVVELGSLIAGPFASRLLCDLGADVIKVEAPDRPDPMRDWGAAKLDGHSLWWPIQSRGKRLVTIDLRCERGQQLCRELLRHADVLIENFRPGTLERWGLGPETMAELNPRLVYARISGYGQTGPYSSRGGFASTGEALSGMRYLNGSPDEPPPRTGLSLGDSLAALFTALGVLAALLERERGGGEGQVVDTSILESCFALLESVAPEYHRLGAVRQPSGTRLANNAPSNLYRSRDGRWMVIAANSDGLFRRLADALDAPELADDERFCSHDARGAHADELDALIAAWAAGVDAAEIETRLETAGVVCAPVQTIAEVFEDPQVAAREMLVPVRDEELGEVLGPGVVPKLSRTPGQREFFARRAEGADNDSVYGELLGLDEQARADLRARGVI